MQELIQFRSLLWNFQAELDLRLMIRFVTKCYYAHAGGSCSVCHGEPLGWLGSSWRQLVGQARKWYGWQDILKKNIKNWFQWSEMELSFMSLHIRVWFFNAFFELGSYILTNQLQNCAWFPTWTVIPNRTWIMYKGKCAPTDTSNWDN